MPTSRRTLLPALVTAIGLAAVSTAVAPAATAAPVVAGAIGVRYADLDGAGGYLGAALTEERATPYRTGAYQAFQAGSIYWSPATGAWDVHGLIYSDWADDGYENSAVGFPTSGENALPGGAAFQSFEAGLYYYAPGAGAHEVRGAILGTYALLGYERSRLGFPTTGELATPDGDGRYQVFENGSVYWSPLTGAHEISGDIRAKWGSIGYEESILGYPVSDGQPGPYGRENRFLLGSITTTPRTGAFVSSFFAPVSSVDRAGRTLTADLLDQTFRYDDNDTFLRLKAGLGGQLESIVLTRKQFTYAVGVGTFLLAVDYSPDPKATATFQILDIGSVPTSPAEQGKLLAALR